MTLEDEIASELSEQMCSQIDFEILGDVLIKSCGWTKVTLTRFFSRKHSINILMWCEEHIKNRYQHRGSTFIFEDHGDAVNFTLKWS